MKTAKKQCWQCSKTIQDPGGETLCTYLLEALAGDATTYPMLVGKGIRVDPQADVTDFICDFDLTMAAFRQLEEQGFYVPYASIEMRDALAREQGEDPDADPNAGIVTYPDQKAWAESVAGRRG